MTETKLTKASQHCGRTSLPVSILRIDTDNDTDKTDQDKQALWENFTTSESSPILPFLQADDPDRSHPWNATLPRGDFWPSCLNTEVLWRKGFFLNETFLYKPIQIQEAVDIANDCRTGLASYFYSGDVAQCWRVSKKSSFVEIAPLSSQQVTSMK